MNTIDKTKLIGFRRPTMEEKSKMQGFIQKGTKRARRVMMFWMLFCGLSESCLLLSLFKSEKGELAMKVVFVVVIGIVMLLLFKSLQEQKKLLGRIENGKFEVLDCKAYEGNPHTQVAGIGTVKIYNEAGQYCEELFRVDEISVEEWKSHPVMSFKLMKCPDEHSGKNDYYELFSERRLERGK